MNRAAAGKRALAALLLAWLPAACGSPASEPAPQAPVQGEEQALRDAGEMLEQQRLPQKAGAAADTAPAVQSRP